MNNRATILIITLWIIALLSAVTLSVTYRIRIELDLIESEMAVTKSFLIAKAGMVQAVNVLNQDGNDYDALNEKWSNYTVERYGINPFKEISVGEGRFSVRYIYERDIFTGYEQVFYGMKDEERKINVNKATQDMLESLPGMDMDIAISIRAWRGDPELGQDVLLSEDSYYKGLDKPYERKGKDIEYIEELLLIRGITQDLLFGKDLDGSGVIDDNEAGLQRYLTVYGKGTININTATATVLRAIGFNEDLSYKIIRYCLGPDEMLGTDDDGIFTDKSKISEQLNWIEPLTQEEMNLISSKQDWLEVSSQHFVAYIESTIPNKCNSFIEVIFDKEADEGKQIVKWIET